MSIKTCADFQTIHIVAGPTAGGKSAYAMDLARKTGGVIVNCDSLQIYDGLPLLTAQPGPADKAEIPHRLYGALPPGAICSAGNWRELALPVIEEILAAGQTPIICGGTGLYIKALMEGLSPMPDVPEDLRQAVIARYEKLGAAAFYAELQTRDPVMAARFHVNHKARIIRAMEVLEATGKSLATWQEADRLAPPAHWRFEVHKIMPARDILRERCDARFEAMLENGALEEVEAFAAKLENGEIAHHVPLTKALGFKALRAHLRGELSREEAIEAAQAQTRQYAKRQVTWFRNQL